MSNRIGGGQGRGSTGGVGRGSGTPAAGREREITVTTGGRKTTSALFREIDDLVGLEDESGKTK